MSKGQQHVSSTQMSDNSDGKKEFKSKTLGSSGGSYCTIQSCNSSKQTDDIQRLELIMVVKTDKNLLG